MITIKKKGRLDMCHRKNGASHVTTSDVNLFLELGFSQAKADALQAQAKAEIKRDQIARIEKATVRALSTINAPLRTPINGVTLISCLRLENTDRNWRPHIRALFNEIHVEILMDLMTDGVVSFHDLNNALDFWDIENTYSAIWVREMVPRAKK